MLDDEIKRVEQILEQDNLSLKSSTKVSKETVNHPSHYNQFKYEVIEVIEDWHLGFNLGNVLKYIGRFEFKGSALDDLKKAQFYLAREIELRERQK